MSMDEQSRIMDDVGYYFGFFEYGEDNGVNFGERGPLFWTDLNYTLCIDLPSRIVRGSLDKEARADIT